MVTNLNNLDRRTGATELLISESEREMGLKLPDDYLAFLETSNGGEGFVANSYVMLWKVKELSSMNRSYETEIYAPDLLIFGSDGGGEAYRFDTRELPWRIVRVPFVGRFRDVS
jgi:SMI1 / KNR4 family (SUKH-1)